MSVVRDLSVLRGCVDPSLQISTPEGRTPVAPVPQVCHRPGAVRACVQRAHGVADYHLFSMWRCWPFATLLANAPERCVRCAERERHRESRPRGERMRVSIASRRGGVRVRCGEAFARRRPLPHTAAIVERESPFQASLTSVLFGALLCGRGRALRRSAASVARLLAPCARGSIIYIIGGEASQTLSQRCGHRLIGALAHRCCGAKPRVAGYTGEITDCHLRQGLKALPKGTP